ncbi:MAG: ATP-binding cassette domain-containing protein, partial [Bdellovibrionales bacterium]|nr:ATP-binding cassette domain-containing protein [Bdellovibrionales bacterium]
MSEILLEARNLTKIFGALRANDDVHLKIRKGSIHGIVGENGAGKSTLLKMLFGIYHPTSGEIRFRDQVVHWKNPKTAIENGIGMVQQHFSLVESLTALDNIILGAEPTRGPAGFLLREEARARLEKLIPSPHLRVPWDAKVEDLSVGFRQRIEILKLLYR